MGEGTCLKCGKALNPLEDTPPSLWCLCPSPDTEPYPDELMDPSEDQDYYEL